MIEEDYNNDFYTAHLRTNLDRTKMETIQKRKAHKKIFFRNVTFYNLIK
jgi:hypothetical protein